MRGLENLNQYYEGKKVIIVGSAGYLEGKKLGAWIDTFDTVIRINHAVPIVNTEDLGTKTTILYHILRKTAMGEDMTIDLQDIQKIKDCGVECLVFRRSTKRIKNVLSVIQNQDIINYHRFTEAFERRCFRKLADPKRSVPNTGVFGILHALEHKVKSLHVIGFDFYASGYITGHGGVSQEECETKRNNVAHDNKVQIQLLHRLYLEDKRVVFDDIMEQIFEGTIITKNHIAKQDYRHIISPKKVPIYADPNKGYPLGYYKESEYKPFVEGKDIIIVAPASYLVGQGKCKWIDSFDVVVRINHALPIQYPEDYGTKTNIIYHCSNHRTKSKDNYIKDFEVDYWEKQNVDWLVFRPSAMSDRARNIGKIVQKKVRFTCLPPNIKLQATKEIGSKTPNTGILAVYHLLSLGVNSITMIGFDFYISGVYKGYGLEEYKEDKNNRDVNANYHSEEAQKKALRRLIQTTGKIIPDERLKEILIL